MEPDKQSSRSKKRDVEFVLAYLKAFPNDVKFENLSFDDILPSRRSRVTADRTRTVKNTANTDKRSTADVEINHDASTISGQRPGRITECTPNCNAIESPAKRAKVSTSTSGDDNDNDKENDDNRKPENEETLQIKGKVDKEDDERNEGDDAKLSVHDEKEKPVHEEERGETEEEGGGIEGVDEEDDNRNFKISFGEKNVMENPKNALDINKIQSLQRERLPDGASTIEKKIYKEQSPHIKNGGILSPSKHIQGLLFDRNTTSYDFTKEGSICSTPKRTELVMSPSGLFERSKNEVPLKDKTEKENIPVVSELHANVRKLQSQMTVSWARMEKAGVFNKVHKVKVNAVNNENDEAQTNDEEYGVRDGEMTTVQGVRLNYNKYVLAVLQKDIVKRINVLVEARWSEEERCTLSVGERRGNTHTKIPVEDLYKLMRVCAAMQKKNRLPDGDYCWLMMGNYFKTRVSRKLTQDRAYKKARQCENAAAKRKRENDENKEPPEPAPATTQ